MYISIGIGPTYIYIGTVGIIIALTKTRHRLGWSGPVSL